MKSHLDKNTLDKLFRKELTGEALLNALKHIETCDVCYQNVPKVTPNEILNKLRPEEVLALNENLPKTAFPLLNYFQLRPNLVWSLVLLLAIIGLGLLSFNLLKSKENNSEVVKKNDDEDLYNPNLTKNVTSKNSNSNENINSNQTDSNLIANNKTDEFFSSNSVIENKNPKNKILDNRLENTELVTRNKNKQKPSEPVSKDEFALKKFLSHIPPKLAQVRPAKVIYRGKNQDVSNPISPNGEVILSDSPTFSWSRVKDFGVYEIVITDKQYNEVDRKITTKTTYKSEKKLERGKVYLWKIIAKKSEVEVSNNLTTQKTAMFKVAENKTITQLEKMKKNNDKLNTLLFMLNEGLLSEADSFINTMKISKSKRILFNKIKNRIKALKSTSINRLS